MSGADRDSAGTRSSLSLLTSSVPTSRKLSLKSSGGTPVRSKAFSVLFVPGWGLLAMNFAR
eukprot:3932231-Rhodomonas_salina.2